MMSAHKPKKSKRPMDSDLVDFYMPDDILPLILKAIPYTEEVVRNGVLKTGLRYVWKSIPSFPSLDFDCSRVVQHTKTLKKEEFKKFVSWALDNNTVDLDSFRLCCAGYYPMSTVCRWIHAAVNRKVKKLDLMVSGKDMEVYEVIVLPHCMLTCESLESLRLYLYGSHIKLPDCNGCFSALKVLELNNVKYCHPDFIKKCLEMCPSLEKLTLIDCVVEDSCYILEISCPKLKTLIIHKGPSFPPIGLVVECPELVFFECIGLQIQDPFILKKVESLKTAVILPQCKFDKEYFCKIFARISHVESLSLNCSFVRHAFCDLEGNFPKSLPNGNFPGPLPNGNFPRSLPNLKTLELTTTFESYDMELLIWILKCSPNLESIHLISHEESFYRVQTMGSLSPCLERVEFLGFERGKWKLDIAGARKCIGENGFQLV